MNQNFRLALTITTVLWHINLTPLSSCLILVHIGSENSYKIGYYYYYYYYYYYSDVSLAEWSAFLTTN